MVTLHVRPWQVWWIDFNPQVGHEQSGLRPGFVIGSAVACALNNNLAIIVPCTTRDRNHSAQPPITLAGKSGAAMCDQMKSLSIQRLIRPHAAGTITIEERPAIIFAIHNLLVRN